MAAGVTAEVSPQMAAEVTAGPWRLTRRGRLAALLGGLLVVMAVLSMVQVAGAATSTSANQLALVAAQEQEHTVTVRPGDSLWSIATRALPHMDPREAVVALRKANNISGGEIVAGQKLVLPPR